MAKENTGNIVELQFGEQISGEVVEIWAATCNEDMTEGRGKTIDHSYHLTKREALIASKGLAVGLNGGDGEVVSRLAIRVIGNKDSPAPRYFLAPKTIVITSDPEAAAKLREQALKKFSPSERAALSQDPD